MSYQIKAALLLSLMGAPLLGQNQSSAQLVTFHVEGMISSPWQSLLRGLLVPRKKLVFHGKQPIRTETTDEKESYVAVPRTEITFNGEHVTSTLVVDESGFFSTDLPVGLYKMTIETPTIGHQALTPYVRQFRVTSPITVVLNGELQLARMTCDVVMGADTPEKKSEEIKNACGGEDSFVVPSIDAIPYQLYIQYPQRQPTDRGYLYISDKIGQSDVPVYVAYNLFSLHAGAVVLDAKTRTIAATGKVVMEDGSGKTQRFDSISFRFENGKAIQLN